MFFTSFVHFSYQIMVLELLSASKDRMHRPSKDKFVDFHVPSGLNLLEDKEYSSQAALWGIEVILYTTLSEIDDKDINTLLLFLFQVQITLNNVAH